MHDGQVLVHPLVVNIDLVGSTKTTALCIFDIIIKMPFHDVHHSQNFEADML